MLAALRRRPLELGAAVLTVAVAIGWAHVFPKIAPTGNWTRVDLVYQHRLAQAQQSQSSFSATSASEPSLHEHWASLKAGVRTMVHHPQGYGLGNVGQTASRTGTPLKAGESNYTELGVELGVLGAVLWTAWGLALLAGLVRAGRRDRLGGRARGRVRGDARARDPDRRDRRPLGRLLRLGARRRARAPCIPRWVIPRPGRRSTRKEGGMATVSTKSAVVGWHELIAPDVEPAKAFYTGLLGWTFSVWKPGEADYPMVHVGGRDHGGFFARDRAPHWLVYVEVEDVDAVVARVPALGGHVFHEPEDIEDVGRYAVIADPDERRSRRDHAERARDAAVEGRLLLGRARDDRRRRGEALLRRAVRLDASATSMPGYWVFRSGEHDVAGLMVKPAGSAGAGVGDVSQGRGRRRDRPPRARARGDRRDGAAAGGGRRALCGARRLRRRRVRDRRPGGLRATPVPGGLGRPGHLAACGIVVRT